MLTKENGVQSSTETAYNRVRFPILMYYHTNSNVVIPDGITNKVASFKRSQCEGCSIIIHLMALYDYYLKYIQGRHIKHTLKLFIWVEPSGRCFKINEVSYGFSWCHISFLWPKVTETGKVVTVSNFSIRLFILFMSKINRNQENVKFANFRYVIKIYTFGCLKLIGTENTWSQTIVTSLPW